MSHSAQVRAVGVVGAGLMASQLALLFAEKLRVPVIMSDLAPDRVDAALSRLREHLARRRAQGRLTADEAAHVASLLRGTTDPSDFSACDAVIEAVFEDLEVKRAVFREAERVVSTDTLLLTNTSSLSVTAMSQELTHPERLVGFHFFNPVAVLPLLELVRTPSSAEAVLSAAADLASRLGKTAIRVADAPGFVVNRLLTRLFVEILGEIDDGGDPAAVDRALAPWGLPMTPLRLIGYIGPAVQRHICEAMRRAFPERFPASPILAAVVDAGLAGFLGPDGGITSEVRAFLPEPRAVDRARVRRRVQDALAQEVDCLLAEGVVAGAENVDRCMVLGANFPGGVSPLLAG